MAAKAIFISETWFKANTPLPTNVDVKDIYPFYQLAQDKYIRDLLGDALYNSLCDSIVSATLTANEIALLELLRPVVAYYTLYEAIPFLANKIKNIGVVKTADDKQTNSDRADIKDLRNQVENNAEYYLMRVQKYLCNNKDLYPDYNFNNEDVNPNTKAGYNCDLYIDPDFIDEKFIRQYYRQ